jgi:hypothetical protein
MQKMPCFINWARVAVLFSQPYRKCATPWKKPESIWTTKREFSLFEIQELRIGLGDFQAFEERPLCHRQKLLARSAFSYFLLDVESPRDLQLQWRRYSPSHLPCCSVLVLYSKVYARVTPCCWRKVVATVSDKLCDQSVCIRS